MLLFFSTLTSSSTATGFAFSAIATLAAIKLFVAELFLSVATNTISSTSPFIAVSEAVTDTVTVALSCAFTSISSGNDRSNPSLEFPLIE